MGYLDNRTITVDAVLTKKGRQLLSQGHDFFKITKFALADDEVDYRLWDTAHPSGSNFYGFAIEQMPILEAPVDETQVMRYKLVSLDKSTTRIPVVTVTPTVADLRVAGDTVDITPGTLSTATGVTFNQTLGYTCILHDSDAATLFALQTVQTQPPSGQQIGNGQGSAIASSASPIRTTDPVAIPVQASPGAGIFLSDSELAKSVWIVGTRFRLVAKKQTVKKNTIVTIVGNESGGSATMILSVEAASTAELPPLQQ